MTTSKIPPLVPTHPEKANSPPPARTAQPVTSGSAPSVTTATSSTATMADVPVATNGAAANGNGHSVDIPGQPFYDKSRLHLKKLLHEKMRLERQLAQQEDDIYKKEGEYLEDTPAGNIITGFENYTKGIGGLGAGRRRDLGRVDSNRVFSRSSVSWNINAQETPTETAQSTPVAAAVPTPLSTAFARGEAASNHATPTSARSASVAGQGGSKKNKKGKDSVDLGRDDDDSDAREVKKTRTNFGAVRK